jgi:hypothetical protein
MDRSVISTDDEVEVAVIVEVYGNGRRVVANIQQFGASTTVIDDDTIGEAKRRVLGVARVFITQVVPYSD